MHSYFIIDSQFLNDLTGLVEERGRDNRGMITAMVR
jgi:hypothetical protein